VHTLEHHTTHSWQIVCAYMKRDMRAYHSGHTSNAPGDVSSCLIVRSWLGISRKNCWPSKTIMALTRTPHNTFPTNNMRLHEMRHARKPHRAHIKRTPVIHALFIIGRSWLSIEREKPGGQAGQSWPCIDSKALYYNLVVPRQEIRRGAW